MMGKKIKSKRQTLKQKYKVEKKVRQHHREVRREARKNKRGDGISKKRLKKDPGIPNTYPYKLQLMEDLERKRLEAEERRKAAAKARREANAAGGAGASSIAEMAARTANFDGEDFDVNANPDDELKTVDNEVDQSRRQFMREFKRVVESADVLLEVLDARDPLGCRCYDAERAVVAKGGKRIVLVLNKVDLVPKAVVDKWLSYLRNEMPTVAFRASTQGGGTLGQARVTATAANSVATSECLGGASLLQLLKNYARSRNIKTKITVGVIGYPNVGKSSLINSLKRARAVNVGSQPGVTRVAQEVRLDSNIALIDCPGICFADVSSDALVLRNAVRVEDLVDFIKPVEMIIKRVGKEPLMVAYSLPKFNHTAELLALICKLRGKFKRGGAFDIDAAARTILTDWNGGKIPFYTLPPKGPAEAQISASVVQQWGDEFDIDKVATAQSKELEMVDRDPRLEVMAVEAKRAQEIAGAEGEVQSYHVAEKTASAADNTNKQQSATAMET